MLCVSAGAVRVQLAYAERACVCRATFANNPQVRAHTHARARSRSLINAQFGVTARFSNTHVFVSLMQRDARLSGDAT
jgi:hypothetical protein